jgi:preprotein translocase subunit SecB
METATTKNSNFEIILDYIKDLSFEIPSADCFIDAAQNLDKYHTKIDISNKAIKDNIIELNCKLIFDAPKEITNRIHAECCLGILFKVINKDLNVKDVERIILIEIPSLYAKKLADIITDLFHKSGFKSFKFSKEISFEELYDRQFTNLTQKN